jgi:hypothetical protein
MGAFEQAWQFLKADFSDIAPFPSRYPFTPEGVPAQPPTEGQRQYAKFLAQKPTFHQDYMELMDYIPDLQEMLELEAIRQASGQQVPRNLLREQDPSLWNELLALRPGDDDYDDSRPLMYNVPKDRQNFPLTRDSDGEFFNSAIGPE